MALRRPGALPEKLEKSTNGRSRIVVPAPVKWLAGALSRVAPPLAAHAAARLFSSPRRHNTPPIERRWTLDVETVGVPSEHGELAAWTIGHGPTVLLVHGWEGRGSQLGAFIGPLVEAGYRVVGFDAPAHGESPGKRLLLPYFSSALRAVAERFGPLEAIVAHSFGSSAAALAVEEGLEVRRLVFLAAPARLDVYVDALVRYVGFTPEISRRMTAIFEKRLGRSWDSLQPARVAEALDDPPPLLMVWDTDDQEVSQHHVPTLREAWGARAELHVTEGLGHRGILRDPAVLARVVSFVREARPSVVVDADRVEA